ncbi:hypothetical protein [Polyangium spumosum]|uniref:Uncharacterized protein n=1 Tax=Polyangium spumosum TaxID=889282 RepID=A0A6N7Q7L6_9BACT|nr:hypothetical protein [Polyangium spumosum]MRG98294.1 hypothetical protein [Polyangium spumosum]
MATKKGRPRRKPEPIPTTKEDEENPAELFAELALGSDGLLYVTAEHLTEEERQGRDRFEGYALTPEETQRAIDTMHTMAFNLTIAAMGKGKAKSSSNK